MRSQHLFYDGKRRGLPGFKKGGSRLECLLDQVEVLPETIEVIEGEGCAVKA